MKLLRKIFCFKQSSITEQIDAMCKKIDSDEKSTFDFKRKKFGIELNKYYKGKRHNSEELMQRLKDIRVDKEIMSNILPAIIISIIASVFVTAITEFTKIDYSPSPQTNIEQESFDSNANKSNSLSIEESPESDSTLSEQDLTISEPYVISDEQETSNSLPSFVSNCILFIFKAGALFVLIFIFLWLFLKIASIQYRMSIYEKLHCEEDEINLIQGCLKQNLDIVQ